MNILKLLTKNGRQSIVREIVKPYVSVDSIANYAAEGVAKALEIGAEKISDERCAQIAIGCNMGGNALIHLTAAVAPDGEGGKSVTGEEKALIKSDLDGAIRALVTQNFIDDIVEKVLAKIP